MCRQGNIYKCLNSECSSTGKTMMYWFYMFYIFTSKVVVMFSMKAANYIREQLQLKLHEVTKANQKSCEPTACQIIGVVEIMSLAASTLITFWLNFFLI